MTELSNNQLYEKLIEAIKAESRSTKQEIKEEIKSENARILDILEQQNEKIKELETKYNHLEQKYLTLERQTRKNNVVIFGLQVNEQDNLLQLVIQKFEELLQVKLSELDLNNVYQIKNEQTCKPQS